MSGLAATAVDICSQIILIKMGYDKATANTWNLTKYWNFGNFQKGTMNSFI